MKGGGKRTKERSKKELYDDLVVRNGGKGERIRQQEIDGQKLYARQMLLCESGGSDFFHWRVANGESVSGTGLAFRCANMEVAVWKRISPPF